MMHIAKTRVSPHTRRHSVTNLKQEEISSCHIITQCHNQIITATVMEPVWFSGSTPTITKNGTINTFSFSHQRLALFYSQMDLQNHEQIILCHRSSNFSLFSIFGLGVSQYSRRWFGFAVHFVLEEKRNPAIYLLLNYYFFLFCTLAQ